MCIGIWINCESNPEAELIQYYWAISLPIYYDATVISLILDTLLTAKHIPLRLAKIEFEVGVYNYMRLQRFYNDFGLYMSSEVGITLLIPSLSKNV